MTQIAIVGGGIAGLATAYYLQELGKNRIKYKLIESAPSFGGKILSVREKGFVVEGGPDSFLTTKPAGIELCRTLGLGDDLIGTNDAGRRVFVWSRGGLRAMPEGVMLIIPTRVMPFVRSPLISWPGKLRMGMDLLIPPRRSDEDESLAHFVRRRLGNEALDKIAEPMIAGIYVADAEYLSLKSTFPRFIDMEVKYGGLLRGVLAQRRARPAKSGRSAQTAGIAPPARDTPAISMFMTLRGGLQDLVDGIRTRLEPAALMPGCRAVRVDRHASGYRVTLEDGSSVEADGVVLAAPTFAAGDLVQDLDPSLADTLRTIRYVSTATVSLGYRSSELTHPLDGFGFVVPRSEQREILACTWTSTKFDGRAAEGYSLVRVFVGGAHAEQRAEEDDAAVTAMARRELRAMMGITAEPVLTRVFRWHKANPQYAVGHADRVAEIDRRVAQHAGLYVTGGAYHGVGIPDCIEDGRRVAGQIVTSAGAPE